MPKRLLDPLRRRPRPEGERAVALAAFDEAEEQFVRVMAKWYRKGGVPYYSIPTLLGQLCNEVDPTGELLARVRDRASRSPQVIDGERV